MTLKTVESRIFQTPSELKEALLAGCYARPKKSNYAAVDAFSRASDDNIVLLRFTRGLNHPISGDQLHKDLNLLRSVKSQVKYQFFFVVPPSRFSEFKARSFVFSDEKNIEAKRKDLNTYIEQWVLELKTTS